LAPFWDQKSTKIQLKIDPKRYQKNGRFLHRISSILVQFWEPSWSHVGHFFAQNTGGLTEGRGFYVGSSFFIIFVDRLGAILAPFWLHFGSILAPLGPIWAGFLKVLSLILAPFLLRS